MPGTSSAVPIQVAVLGGGLLVVLAIVLLVSYFRSVGGSPPDTSAGAEFVDVSVETLDELSGRTYLGADRVIARLREWDDGERQGVATESVQIGLTAGEGEAELEYGAWIFEVEEGGETIGQRTHDLEYGFESDHIGLSVEPNIVEVVVIGGPDREPLSGTAVEARADVGDWNQQKLTDPEGRVRFEVPRSASTVSFTATHETLPPMESQVQVERAAREGVTLSTADTTGAMTVETTVGDRPWPEVDVRITPVSGEATVYTDEGTVTTKSDGSRTVEGLPAGEYEVTAHPRIETVDTTGVTESVVVAGGETTEPTLAIGVSYAMDDTQRARLAELRDRIGSLATASNRDVAIPRYYGTVLTSVLDLVEGVESEPERAVASRFPPDAVVEALLEAVEAGLDAVSDAMSERRVVSLFEACEPMSPVQVDWSTEPALGAFFDRVRLGGDRQRQRLRDRLEETDDVLDRRWSEVNESAPLRKLHDRIEALARETDELDEELLVVARTCVGICLLDAIVELFEHDALVERLNGRTL